MSATTSQGTSANAGDFFNLHTVGIGYLNRVRRVPVKGRGRKADEFLACSIAAMRGLADDLSYTYFDCRVSGAEAQEIVEKLMADVEQNRKVVIGFCIGDAYPHLYERDKKDQDGRKTGEKEWAALIKGRLLRIDFVTIDGERVYTRKPRDVEDGPEGPVQQSDGKDGGMPDDELPPVRGQGDANDSESDQGRNDEQQRSRQSARRDSPQRDSQRADQRGIAIRQYNPQQSERQRFERDEVPA